MIRRTLTAALFLLVFATAAQASWYDDYDAGLAATRKGNWALTVQKMSAAIKGNPREGDRVKTYGVIMINYHPYYYRGVAYLNTGRYEEAVADFEKTSGPGPENLGSLDVLMARAKKELAGSEEPSRPEPPRVETPRPAPAQPSPAVPQMDPALRQRASSALSSAKQKIVAAQQRRATASPQYAQAMSMFTDATTRNASARNNDDLNAVVIMAGNASDLAELAMPPSAAPPVTVPSAAPVIPKPAAATTTIMEDYTGEVRRALEFYFAGEFDDAVRRFEELSRKMPDNGWIWAFLGASQYSMYAFEADDAYRSAAVSSFRRAKQLRSWREGLPPKYFSKRIRKAFSETAG